MLTSAVSGRELPETAMRGEVLVFELSEKTRDFRARIEAFMDELVYPNEARFHEQLGAAESRWSVPPVMEELKEEAKARGLWNLFLPDSDLGAGLTNLEYASLCEVMGRSPIAPEAFNCNAPDTGNMEVLVRYGTEEQKERWLRPLLDGEIRSCFAMTEPGVASSDATNIEASIERDGDEYVVNGRKWWISGAGDPRCRISIFMGKTDPDAPRHEQQSMILVPLDTPGVKVERTLPVFGYDDAPHGHAEISFDDVRESARGAGYDTGLDLGLQDGDRAGAPPDLEGGPHDGYGREQRGQGRDRHDQGRRPKRRPQRPRPGHTGARGRRGL